MLFCALYAASPSCYVLYVLLLTASVYSHVFHVSTSLIVYMLYTYLSVASVYSSMFHIFTRLLSICCIFVSQPLRSTSMSYMLICLLHYLQFMYLLACSLCIHMLLPCVSCIPLLFLCLPCIHYIVELPHAFAGCLIPLVDRPTPKCVLLILMMLISLLILLMALLISVFVYNVEDDDVVIFFLYILVSGCSCYPFPTCLMHLMHFYVARNFCHVRMIVDTPFCSNLNPSPLVPMMRNQITKKMISIVYGTQ